jgi:tetratricopeptide (TPR) repeat protein
MRLFFALLLFSSVAGADDRAVAREHYNKGTKLFELGRYDDAIAEYDLAYQAKNDPVLLYNIAQAHRLAGHAQEAVDYYQSFLEKSPNSPRAAEVQLKIDELKRQLSAKQGNKPLFENGEEIPPPTGAPPTETPPPPAAPAAAPPPPPTAAPVLVVKAPPPAKPIYKKWWFWTAIGGAAVAAIVVGLAVGTPTHTTIVSDCRFGVGNMGCAR